MSEPRIDMVPRSLFRAVWKNGAEIEVLFYDAPLENEDPSDRLHLMLRAEGEAPRGWLMNAEDATDIIHGLAMGIQELIEHDVPMRPAGPQRS